MFTQLRDYNQAKRTPRVNFHIIPHYTMGCCGPHMASSNQRLLTGCEHLVSLGTTEHGPNFWPQHDLCLPSKLDVGQTNCFCLSQGFRLGPNGDGKGGGGEMTSDIYTYGEIQWEEGLPRFF